METSSRLFVAFFVVAFLACACAEPPDLMEVVTPDAPNLPGSPVVSTAPGAFAVVSSENFRIFTKSSPSSFSGMASGTLYRISDPLMAVGAETLEGSP